MNKFAILSVLAVTASGAALLSPAPASAMPLALAGASAGSMEPMIQQVRSRQVRVYRPGPRVVYRNRGWNRGAVIGGAAALGVLGAAAVAAPYYNGGYGCYIQQRPVYDSWGQYMGVQNVRVCP